MGIDFEADALGSGDWADADDTTVDSAAMPSQATLTDIGELCLAMKDAIAEVERQEEELKQAKARLLRIEQELLPNALKSAHLAEFKLISGETLTIKEEIAVHVNKDNEPVFFTWLRDNEHGSIIKREMKVAVPAKSGDLAERVAAALRKEGAKFNDKEFVHPQTLKSFVKNCREEGINLPDEVTVHPYSKAVLK